MTDTVTLEQVKTLAAKLPPRDQLRLVAHLSGQLSSQLPPGTEDIAAESSRQQRQKAADELLAILDDAAEQVEGAFDSVQDLRQLRAERDEQLCPSKQ
jgi:hypothetical protein